MIASAAVLSALHSHAAREQHLGVAVLPGAQQVARAEQLGRRVVADRRLAHQQAVEHEQADRVAAAHERAAGVPGPARNVDRRAPTGAGDLAHPPRIEAPRQLWVGLEKLYRSVPGVWHALVPRVHHRAPR